MKKKNGLQRRQYRPWPCTEYAGGIPQGEIPCCNVRHPLDANSSKLSSVLKSLMAKWKLITFWLYQILIQPTFKNFPSLLSNLPLAGPVDKGALRWGSAKRWREGKGGKIRQRTSPASSTSALFPQMKPLFQSEAKREAIDWKMIFYSLSFHTVERFCT